MNRKLSVLFLGFILSIMVACSNGTNNQANNGGQEGETTDLATSGTSTVTMVMWSAPDTFNPYFSQGNYGKYAGGELVLETMLAYDPNYEIVPRLAESYEVSEDGLEYVFNLRNDVNWHDGTPFTAHDVAFTFRSIMDPDWVGTGYVDLSKVVGAEDYKEGKTDEVAGIEIEDDYTIKVVLEEVYAPFLEAVGIGLWILPEHVFADVEVSDMANSEFSKFPIGTGPVKFVKYATDQYVEYETYENYYLGKPEFDKFILRIMTPDVALGAFSALEVDTTSKAGIGTINISDYGEIQKNENLDIVVFDTMDYQEITVNTQQTYLADKRVRQAIMYALDRQTIVDQLLQGMGKVANSPIAEESPWYNEKITPYEYNPEKAKQLLEEADWDFNREITLSVPKGNLLREKSAPFIQQYLGEIGMKVNLEFMDFATLIELMSKQELDMALLGTSTGKIDPDSNLYTFYHSEQLRPTGWNTANYKNERMDTLLDQGAVEPDQEKRKEIYDEIQEMLMDELPSIVLYYEQAIGATNKQLKNATPNEIGIEWNLHEWVLE